MALKLPISKELEIIAETELNEIPSRVKDDIAHIRTWLTQQSYIKARTDDFTLLIFLRACKFSLEKTKMRLELFYTVKTAFPDVFKNRNPLLAQYQYALEINDVAVLPGNLNGPTLVAGRFGNIDADIFTMTDVLRICTMMVDVILREYPNCSIAGIVTLIDMSVIPFKYVPQITLTLLKKIVTCLGHSYPVRIKGIYLINAPSAWVSLFSVLKSLLPKKLKTRILCFASNGDETVRQYYSTENLPLEFGGTAGPFSELTNQFKEKFNSYHDWFVQDEEFGCVKHKKPQYFLQKADLFGLDGSFRKLEID